MTEETRSTMRAWRLTHPRRFEQVTTPVPRPAAEDDVVLRTIAGGICGSDLPYFDGAVSSLFDDSRELAAGVPGYPIHEVVGEVLHSRDPDLPVGSIAVGWATDCNALAELTCTKAGSLATVSEQVLDAAAPEDALLLQPLACVLDTMARVGPVAGRHVAVIGLGGFGLLFAHAARALGASRVTGVDPIDRSDVAAHFGLDLTLPSRSDRWARSLDDDQRPDLVIEAVGHQTQTLTDAVAAAAPGGTVFTFGVPDDPVYPLPMQQAFQKSLTLRTGVVTERRKALESAAQYVDRHPDLAGHVFTHTWSFDDATRAFEQAARSRPGQVKVRLVLG